MAFTQYSADKVIITWSAFDINGIAEDTFVEIERDEDGFTTYTGALGDVCRTRSLNHTGKITITLMQTAPINNDLSRLAQIDEDEGTEVYPIQIKDTSGNLLVSGAEAWIMKRPKIERSAKAGTIQWVFAVADLEIFEGGADL